MPDACLASALAFWQSSSYIQDVTSRDQQLRRTHQLHFDAQVQSIAGILLQKHRANVFVGSCLMGAKRALYYIYIYF